MSSLKLCGLSREANVPGHSTLSRFKKELHDASVLDQLYSKVVAQIESQGLQIKKGQPRVDASIQKL